MSSRLCSINGVSKFPIQNAFKFTDAYVLNIDADTTSSASLYSKLDAVYMLDKRVCLSPDSIPRLGL